MMKANKYLSFSLICGIVFCFGCRDYSSIYLGGNSAEDVLSNVEKNKDILDKINAESIKKNHIIETYDAVDTRLIAFWASPEIMTRWYKIWLESAEKSKEAFNTKEYINKVAYQALIWFLRTNDRKAIEDLPVLVKFPLLEEAKKQYLQSSHKEFADWVKVHITVDVFAHYKIPEFYYYYFLESIGLITDDYELVQNANRALYLRYAPELGTIAVSNLAFYANKLGKVTDGDRDILINYYGRYLKGQPLSKVLRKRDECIIDVLKKYHIVEEIDVLPTTYRETSQYEFMKLYNKPKTPEDYWEYKGKKGQYHVIDHYSRVDQKSMPGISETVIIKTMNMPDDFPSTTQKDEKEMDGQK